MSREFVSYEVADGVATLRLERPEKKNAINLAMRGEIEAAIDTFEDGDAGVLVVTGSGDSFSAGTDITELPDRAPGTVREAIASEGFALPERLAALDRPTVAELNGIAVGGGLELALGCDVRIAAADVEMGLPEITIGGLPGEGGTQRLPREVGPGNALWLVLSGERIDAERAREMGLVQRVHPPEELAAETTAFARSLAERDRAAVLLAKHAVRAAGRSDLEGGLALEGLFAELIETLPERRERLREFIEG